MILHRYANNLKKIKGKETELLNIPSVGEDLAVGGLELVGAWLEYLCDDVWPFPRRGKLMAVLVALDEAEH
jgi:hypothetical protein